jgi:hypothetical protein
VPGSLVLVGAGDIAQCGSPGAEATARLLDQIDGTVFTAGDNAYPNGSNRDFTNCYEPTWGRHRERTFPTAGNHDYETSGADPYFSYFGEMAGTAGQGYYVYFVGPWRIIALNSEVGVRAGSFQYLWLRNELMRNAVPCTAAIWHRPLFTSGPNRDNPDMRDIFRLLHDFRAEIVINGHDHMYERFAPQDADGGLDPVRGQFTGHAFEQQHGCAGLLQSHGVGAHLPRLGFLTALNLVTTEDIHRLRRQPQVRAYRHAALGQLANRLGQPGRAFQFDHMGTGLHQCGAVVQGLFEGGVGHKGQVGEDQCAPVAAFDAGGVVGHIAHADRQGAVMALQNHTQGVAHQQYINPGLAGGLGEGGVIAGQHGDFLAALLEAVQGGQGYIRHENCPHSGIQSAVALPQVGLHWPRIAPVRGNGTPIVLMGRLEVNCRCYRPVTGVTANKTCCARLCAMKSRFNATRLCAPDLRRGRRRAVR